MRKQFKKEELLRLYFKKRKQGLTKQESYKQVEDLIIWENNRIDNKKLSSEELKSFKEQFEDMIKRKD